MQSEDNNSQKYVIVATLAFIVGFGLSWLIMANKANAPEVAEDMDNPAGTVEEGSADVDTAGPADSVVADQNIQVSAQPAGTNVSVSSATLSDIGWVVIHEDNAGIPGKILGAQLFDVGTHSGTVELLRGTVSGGTYYAMLHSDNGDRAFDPKKDVPLLGSTGDPLMTSFQTN